VLADFIVSDEIEGKNKFRFVRIPGKKRVYASRMDIDISTKFSDWIEPDLLQVDKNDITKVTIRDYSINERSGRLQNRDTIVLNKDGEGWKAKKMTSKQEVNTTKMNDFLKALDELSIVDVRPKPEGLTQSLRKSTGKGMSITQEAAMSLQPKGFYFTREGELVSNEGEVQARTREGLVYTLRFGEVVHGADASDSDPNAGENRYLFLTTTFDGSQFVEPPKPKNTDFTTKPDSVWTNADRHNKELQDKHDAWAKKIEAGQKRSTELNEHFAHWYYVISSKSFEKIHLKRTDLLKNKKTT